MAGTVFALTILGELMGEASRRPRLIMLTQWFDPEPTMKGLKFARRMSELGFDVEVVTGFPNYPGGKVYDGYKIRPIHRERHGSVSVTRLALYPSHDGSKIGRILNYLTFFLTAFSYLTFFARKADIVYAYHPPLTVSLAATLSKLFRRSPVVIDIQDMWPDTLKATGMISDSRVLGLIDSACRWTYRRVDHIVVLSNGFKALLAARNVPSEKVTVIYNWADELQEDSGPAGAQNAFGPAGVFRVLFAGNLGRAQALDTVLDAANLLSARSDIEFCFLGSGLELDRLQQRATQQSLTNVRFLPRVPASEVGAYLADADALLVHLKADPLFEITVPSKTQAYLQAGRPIIMAVPGDAAQLIRNANAGVVVSPEDPRALADAVAALAEMPDDERALMGQNAGAYYAQELSFSKGAGSFAALFRSLIGRERCHA
jgi:colanic acid biosynthesis glycosyl transferase WcaI